MNISTRNKLESLFSDSIVRHYKKGHIFIFNGDSTDYCYNLVSGRIKVYDITYRGDEIIIDRFGPHSYFPMSLILNSNRTEYIYEADDDVHIKMIGKEKVLAFLELNPYVVLDLFANLYRVLDDTVSRYVLATTKNAKLRLIFAIIRECKRFGLLDSQGTHVLEISERELAAASGLSRETVSREMKTLKSENLIVASRNIIKITSLVKLEEYLQTHA